MNHATFVNMQYKYLLDAFVLWDTLNRVFSIRLNIYCSEFDSRSAYASVPGGRIASHGLCGGP